MNSAMRGITQKKARKQIKIAQMQAYITHLETQVGKLLEERKNNATVTPPEGQAMPNLFGDSTYDFTTAEESRGAMFEGQDSSGQVGSPTSEVQEEKVVMAHMEGMEGD